MLSEVSLFQGLSPDDLATIEKHTVCKRYRKHTVLMERGDEANSLYVITEGRVKAYVADDQGKEIVLSEQGPGECFGELALLGGTPRTASIMTLTDTACLILTKHSFSQCLAQHPEVAVNLIRELVARTRSLTEAVTDLALLDVYGRLAKTLQESAAEEDGRLMTPRFTHQELADRVGASREMITKILKDLRVGGYVTVDGKRFVIHRALPANW